MATRAIWSRGPAILILAGLLPACGSGGSGGAGGGGAAGGMPAIPDFVVSGAGGRTLTSKGGAGTTAAGGSGGSLSISGISGSDLMLLGGAKTVDTTFSVKAIHPYLGANPLVFTTPGPATLTPPLVGSSLLGQDGLTPATGLHVGPGVTLTIATNSPNAGNRTGIVMTFAHGVLIEGTIVTARQDLATPGDAASLSAASLSITAGENVVFTSVGSIDTRGSAGTSGTPNGGNGGAVFFDGGADGVYQGTIQTNGGDGFASSGTGGTGGAISLISGSFLFSTGSLTASGGASPASTGGTAGAVALVGSANNGAPAETAACFVSSIVTAKGGPGATGGGAGPSGTTSFVTGTFGVIVTNNQGSQ